MYNNSCDFTDRKSGVSLLPCGGVVEDRDLQVSKDYNIVM